MKWSEVIMVRSTGRTSGVPSSTLKELMNDVVRDCGEKSIRVFHRENIDTDYSIVLFHESETAEKAGSRLGQRLAAAFKEFGMVHHAVWIEMDPES